MKTFLRTIQYVSKNIENLSAQTDMIRKISGKKQRVYLARRTHKRIQNCEKARLIPQLPCLAHYKSKSENVITNNAGTKGQGAHYGKHKKTEN